MQIIKHKTLEELQEAHARLINAEAKVSDIYNIFGKTSFRVYDEKGNTRYFHEYQYKEIDYSF